MELVGQCRQCGKDVFCRDGFLDGVVGDDQQLYCFDCHDDKAEDRPTSES